MLVSGLLSSWAMPETSWPSAAIFSVCSSLDWISRWPVMSRYTSSHAIFAPPRHRFGRVFEASREAVDQCIDRAQSEEAARFQSHDLGQAVANHPDISRGVQQKHTGIDRIRKAMHFRFQPPFLFKLGHSGAVILEINQPSPAVIAASLER